MALFCLLRTECAEKLNRELLMISAMTRYGLFVIVSKKHLTIF